MSFITKSIFTLSITLVLNSCGTNEASTQPTSTPIKENLAEEEGFIPLANTIDISDKQYFRVLSPTQCTQSSKNRFIYQVMQDSYLWANNVPELDYTNIIDYNSSEKILEKLKSEKDHFSFIIDAQEAQSYFEEGKNNNFGFGLQLIPLTTTTYGLVINFVYLNSPADKAGLKRGNIITLVNNTKIQKATLNEISELLSNQKTLTFSLLSATNSPYTKTVTKSSYDIKTILYSNYFTNKNNNKKVAYMVFQDFIDKGTKEIDALFTKFNELDANELIVDLRYNGGGSETVAKHLASLIGGSNVSENIFHNVYFNERYSEYNEVVYFDTYNPQALNLKRVFFITTQNSCSASELLINALRASANNVEVIQIGTQTCGKPYGFIGSGLFCDKALYAINMETKNSDNVGNYVQGLKPTCQADDNVLKDFGSLEETSLVEALNYINNNQCTVKSKQQEKINLKTPLTLPRDGFKRIMRAY
jgi:C-terminal processing protease CtpA/Prc